MLRLPQVREGSLRELQPDNYGEQRQHKEAPNPAGAPCSDAQDDSQGSQKQN